MDLLIDILITATVKKWSEMSRRGIIIGVIVGGSFGAVCTLMGAAALAHIGPPLGPWITWSLLACGLFLLGDAVFAAAKYLRIKPEPK